MSTLAPLHPPHATQLPAAGRVFMPEGMSIPRDYVPLVGGTHALYHLELPPSFEGPLDLLLFLIKRHQLDIFDIPMAFVCSRYLEHLERLQEEGTLDHASEFMVMAAELMHLKSRMLLPQPEQTAEEVEGDPRAELVARLLEYQCFVDAAVRLETLDQLGRDTFDRTPQAIDAPDPQDMPLREVGTLALVKALNKVLARQKPQVRHQVVVSQVPMRRRMLRLVELLADQEEICLVDVLAEVSERVDLIVVFLAILEMAKLGLVMVSSQKRAPLMLEHGSGEAPEDGGTGKAQQQLISDEEDFAQDEVMHLTLKRRFATSDEALGRIAGLDDLAYAG